MAKTYLVTCQYKGKDFKDFYTTVVYPPFDEEGEPVEPEDKFGKELAEDIIEVAGCMFLLTLNTLFFLIVM